MNQYKEAWLRACEVGYEMQSPAQRRKGKKQQAGISKIVATNQKEAAMFAIAFDLSRKASKSSIAGRAGIALRVGGRIGVRVIPIVSAMFLAKDLYDIGKWMYQEF